MTASLERCELRGRRRRPQRRGRRKEVELTNKSQRNSMFYSPTKDQRHCLSCSRAPNKTLPSRATVHHLFSSSSPSPGAGHGPNSNIRAHGGKERNDQIHPPSSLPALPAPAYACTYWVQLALSIGTAYRVSVRFYYVTVPFHRHGFSIRFYAFGHLSLPQARALHSLKLQMIQQDCTSLYTAMRLYLHLPSQRDLLIRCNSDPVGRCGPGQQHGHALSLLPHNRQHLVDPLFPVLLWVGKGRERALRDSDGHRISDTSS